ncbi:MAG: L-idonate 5-dehydrogenase [Flavobacteriales bacterium]|jgi:L-idonate 5-dehydrogenase
MKNRVCRLYGQNDLRVENENVLKPGLEEVLVKVAFGGICGSDMHYFHHGGIGEIRVQEPIILGHEFSGAVFAVGEDVIHVQVGEHVAINPSRSCGSCSFCAEGLNNHCLTMRFSGSAMYFPHEQGGFRDFIVVHQSQCIVVDKKIPLSEIACSEPLSVGLHALNQAGGVHGKKVLVSGVGPIGSLCVAAVKNAGASEVVAIDINDTRLKIAKKMGADRVLNATSDSNYLKQYAENKGYFDLSFECSGASVAIETALRVIRPQGTIVQVGVSGRAEIPLGMIVGKEINFVGSHRFHSEFLEAAKLISRGEIDVSPILTSFYLPENALEAIRVASEGADNVKVQLSF